MAGHPLRALGLKRLDLVLGGAVKFLARDVLVDFRRAFPVRAVGAAKVCSIGYTCRTFLLAAAKAARTRLAAGRSAAGRASLETTGSTVLAVAEGLAVATGKTAAVPLAVTAGTVAKRLTVPVAEGLAVTVTKLLTLATAETTTVTFAVTARTITKRLPVPITVGLAVTVTKLLTLTTAETTTITFAITTRTITKRLTITITERPPISAAAGAAGGGVAVTVPA
ncbi:hypothetical protein [Arthrobacter sp. MAHUQ-56]